jgi:Uma2 family endonuclease
MRTLFVSDPPPAVEDWLAQRHALGQDLYDEVWEGEYHVAPGPGGGHADLQIQLARILGPLADRVHLLARGPSNIGGPGDFRVPDLTFSHERADLVWYPSAAIVVEIVSPRDESRRKFDFYHQAGVDEVLIVDPVSRTVEWFERGPDAFRPVDGSALLDVTSAELAASIAWPE